MTTRKASATEITEAKAALHKLGVRPGATIYTGLNHVARSGMMRHISLYVVNRHTSTRADGKRCSEARICNITGLVGRVLGYQRPKRSDGLVARGGGMDMGFHLVYGLGRAMFPRGGSLDKTNGMRRAQAERAAQPHEPLVEEALKAEGRRLPPPPRETDGGYLLRHEWL